MHDISPSPELAPAALPSLPARFFGVITSPRETFAAVAAHPRWIGMLALTVLVSAGSLSWFASTEVGQQAMIDQQVATTEAFGQTVSDQDYARMQQMAGYMGIVQGVTIAIMSPLMTALVAGILFGAFSAFGGTAAYRQVFAVTVHAGAISALQSLVIWPFNYVRESASSPTNLSVFFPMIDEGSFLASVLGTIDLFILWWVIVLAIGMSVLYRRRTAPIAWSLFAVYGVIAVIVGIVKSAWGA
jgi:hypothetical protein